MKQAKETFMEIVFLLAACMSIASVALICIFLFANGLPAMKEIGLGNFLLGRMWKPGADIYGIFPMIVGSVYVTGLALAMGVPVAILTAVYLAFFCPQKAYRVVKPAIELMAGIPSVVYGFFGIAVLVPLVRTISESVKGRGNSIFTAALLLAVMILPTVIGVIEPALRAVPRSYYEGALALGATACSVGRPLMGPLHEKGAEGVKEKIEEITRDLRYAMAMTCSKDIKSIDPSIVRMGSFTW